MSVRGTKIILNKNMGNIKKIEGALLSRQKGTFKLIRNLPTRWILWEKSMLFLTTARKRNSNPNPKPVPK
jgi:hypothetical protein